MTTPTTPATVEPGQIWRDNDQRTKGSGEFVVLNLFVGELSHTRGEEFAHVERVDTGRKTNIRTARLLNGTNTQRGYTYLGMSR